MAPRNENRQCATCGKSFTVPAQNRRQHCIPCKPPRKVSGVTRIGAPDLSLVVQPGTGVIESRVRGELEDMDRAESVAGALAMRLARQLDVEATTGSQAASLSKMILELLARASEGVEPPADWLDEIAERRQSREAEA